MAVYSPGLEFCRLRVYLDETDRWNDKPIFEVIVDLILSMGLADVTLVRGQEVNSQSRASPDLRASLDLPVIVEALGPRYRIDAIVPRARRVVGDRVMTVESVEIAE